MPPPYWGSSWQCPDPAWAELRPPCWDAPHLNGGYSLAMHVFAWLTFPWEWEYFHPRMSKLLVPSCLHWRLSILGHQQLSRAWHRLPQTSAHTSYPLGTGKRVANVTP